MKKILLFDTSYGTKNMGDYIINEAISEEMEYLLKDNFVVRYGTHNPILRFTQTFKQNGINNYCKNADYKFICGTNIISKNLDHITNNFNINLYDANNYKESILLGCGMSNPSAKLTFRTRMIYKKILSKEYVHSTRDEETKRFLESLGFRAINTGCPTTWSLTKKFCKTIPTKKSNRVIFTLTDYEQHPEYDQSLINLLKKNYGKIYYWVQGSRDLEYFKSLTNTDKIQIVPPNLKAYAGMLNSGDIDYVGTRLHAGVYAMRHHVRSIILIVDNRARDMKQSYNLVTIERDSIEKELEALTNSDFTTDIRIDEGAIAKWKGQFK